MRELVERGHIFIAQPPLYRVKRGRGERYIKDEKEFTREIIRLATDGLQIHYGSNGRDGKVIDADDVRKFLLQVDEYVAMFERLERRLRNPGVVEVLSDVELLLDTKEDYQQKANVSKLAARLKELDLTAEVLADEMHSAWMVSFREATDSERLINLELAAQPEYRRLRSLSRQMARFNQPPFQVISKRASEMVADCVSLLRHVKGVGMKDATIQRYKGLGEMNASQLWDTTMNAETRRLLQVRIDDAVESEEIFSTLMGENVESRRKFIADNALDVKNLDI